jgi:hypothetical protein
MSYMDTKYLLYGRWAAQILAAAILLQTLFFKFTLHPDSIALFGQLGLDAAAIIALGVVELIVAILILVPKTMKWGVYATIALMFGALLSHVFVLGFANPFLLAVVTLLAAIAVLVLEKKR